jgi:hypothetical protein
VGMKIPVLILALSLALWGATLSPDLGLPPEAMGLVALGLVAGLVLMVAVLVVRLLVRWRRGAAGPGAERIVLDGSNLLYWLDETPQLRSVQIVLDRVRAGGLVPVVWFDANVGYLIGDRWLGPGAMARLLDLDAGQVFVAPKGTPADPLLLDAARALGVRVVSNDRFRDWTETRPWLAEPGFLMPGRIRGGVADLPLGAVAVAPRRVAPGRTRRAA